MHIPNIFKAGNFAILFLALFVFNGVSSSQVPEDEPISVKTDLIQTNITVTDKKIVLLTV